MTQRKIPTELAPFAPTRNRPREWGVCQSCGRERRLEGGEVVAAHRAWTFQRAMVPCSGGGEAPLRVTA